jgi:hypothetical protein
MLPSVISESTDLFATFIQIAYRFDAVPRGQRCLELLPPVSLFNAALIPGSPLNSVPGPFHLAPVNLLKSTRVQEPGYSSTGSGWKPA